VSFASCLSRYDKEVDFVNVSPDTLVLYEGMRGQLTVNFYPPEASYGALWGSTTDDKVARVDNNFTVTAVGEGKCKIVCYAGDKSDTCYVFVFGE